MATLGAGYAFGATEEVTAAKLGTLVTGGSVSGIVAADITDGTITNAKINSIDGGKLTGLASVPAGAGVLPAANSPAVNSYSSKTTPVAADAVAISDSADSNANKKVTVENILKVVYPIGCIYTNITGTNPNTELGFGTWSAFGAGRVMVGYDSGDSDFDAAEETGGSKTHTLTEAEMPSHTHSIQTYANYNNSVNISGTGNTSTQTSETTGSAGSDNAHNNVQPYIVAHFWKRTA